MPRHLVLIDPDRCLLSGIDIDGQDIDEVLIVQTISIVKPQGIRPWGNITRECTARERLWGGGERLGQLMRVCVAGVCELHFIAENISGVNEELALAPHSTWFHEFDDPTLVLPYSNRPIHRYTHEVIAEQVAVCPRIYSERVSYGRIAALRASSIRAVILIVKDRASIDLQIEVVHLDHP